MFDDGMMKRKLTALSQRYVTALRKHLKQGPQASLQPARGLGRQAVNLGLETLDVAKIHEGALATLKVCGGRNGSIKLAEIFFTEAVTPIEKTHRAGLKANSHLNRVNKTLDRRAVDLAATNRSLKQSIVRRKSVEKTLKKRVEHSKKLLRESLALQKHLQCLAHRIMAAQEDKRKEISRDLQDEIAQILLGINVRLLSLKTAARGNTANLTKKIASTQRLVEESVQSINRFADELDIYQPA